MRILCKHVAIYTLCVMFVYACKKETDPQEEEIEFSVPESISFNIEGGSQSISVTKQTPSGLFEWEATLEAEENHWCILSQNGLTLNIIVKENTYPSQRQNRINVRTPSGKSAYIIVTQEGTGVVVDGNYHTYLSKTKGNGVDVVIMGDGFTEMSILSGAYINALQEAAEGFLGTQPYKAYRDYFNIYFVEAISEERGIGDFNSTPKSKFKTRYDESVSSEIYLDISLCFTFAGNAPITDIDSTLVILVANDPRPIIDYGLWVSGRSLAVCFMSTIYPYPYDFKSLVRRCASSAFARIANEYPYYQQFVPSEIIELIESYHAMGWYFNVDITDDLDKVVWKDFIGKPKYYMVSAYEGGVGYFKGVWRSEHESCMNNNIAYFNAPCRAAIVKRILTLSGETFSLEAFMENDIIEPPPATKFNGVELIPPLPLHNGRVFIDE